MNNDKMTIVFFSGTFDKAVAMLTMATAGASLGMDVTVFVTFWGLSFLKKGKKFFKKNILQKMMEFIIPSRMDKLPLTTMNMLGLGPVLMKKMMKQKGSPGLNELLTAARELGVKFYGCSTSCSVMGVEKDNMIDEVQGIVGATAYLKTAKESKINLFI
jgi:peroxiredoxin family protein